MKWYKAFSVMTVVIVFIFTSCELIPNEQNSSSKLVFKVTATNKTNLSDTVLFTGQEIKMYNNTTGEITFTDSLLPRKLKSYHWLKCYLGNDSLFNATLTSDIMSSIVNDLVLNHNLQDGKYYFADGYPKFISSIETNTLRLLNFQKREKAWNRFINQLKLDGHYKD